MDIRIPKEAFPSVTDWVTYNYLGDHSFPNAKFVPLEDLNPTFVNGAQDGKSQKVITHLDYIPSYILIPNDGNYYCFGSGVDFGDKKVVINWNGAGVWSPFYSTISRRANYCVGHYAPLNINMGTSATVYNLFSRAHFNCYIYTDLSSDTSFTWLWFSSGSTMTKQTTDYYLNLKGKSSATLVYFNLDNVIPVITSGHEVRLFNIESSLNITSLTGITKENILWILKYGLLKVDSSQTLTIGATNLALLNDDEKKIATEKGWTLA